MTGGVTTITDRVVERIAGQAATEVPFAGGSARRVLGVAVGEDREQDRPHVAAHVQGGTVTVDVTMSVVYPEPVEEVAQAVRRNVEQRVATLTGLDVAQVDITVTSLLLHRTPPRRVQ